MRDLLMSGGLPRPLVFEWSLCRHESLRTTGAIFGI
jgi:hypothetical protein